MSLSGVCSNSTSLPLPAMAVSQEGGVLRMRVFPGTNRFQNYRKSQIVFYNFLKLRSSSPICSQEHHVRNLHGINCRSRELQRTAHLCLSRSSWPIVQSVRNRIGLSRGVRCKAAVENGKLEEVKVKVRVGKIGSLNERVFSFQKIFGPSSTLLVVTLPKPFGIVFEESPWKDAKGKHRVVVGDLVPGGNADRASRVSRLFIGEPKKSINNNMPLMNGGVRPGDILRATTTVGVIVDFFGLRRPQRVIDLYVADGKPWHLTMRALNASFIADGDLSLVFERRN